MKPLFPIIIASLTLGCKQAPQDLNNPTVPTPNPIVLAGEVTRGAQTATELRRQGFAVETVLNGRADGIRAFCTSQADAMVITNITSDEHQRCRDLRDGAPWGWSAMSTENDATLYIRRGYADDFLERRSGS